MEQAIGLRHGHQRGDLGAATRLAEHGDVARVAAELVRMLAHPAQGVDQVQLADVTGVAQAFVAALAEIQVAERVEPVVDGDHDDIAAAAQVHAVVEGVRTGAVVVAAAVDVEQDGTLAAVAQGRRIDVEEQAVLADGLSVGIAALGGRGAETGGIARAGPGGFTHRSLEPPAGGVAAVGDTTEHVDAAFHEPGDAPAARGRERRSGSRSGSVQAGADQARHRGGAGKLAQEIAARVGRRRLQRHGTPVMTPVSKG